jgi:pyruvate dehydrogenase E2 component (dihydrolipoamide acetyltransferase)
MAVFTLPDLGEGLQEAEIVSWHVTEGDHVVTDQPLVAVETDKAVVEIPSPRSARVTRLHGGTGDRVAVGDPLVEFESADAAVDTGTVVGTIEEAPAAASRPAGPGTGGGRMTPAVRALARKLGVDTAMVQGTGPGAVITTGDVERAAQVLADAAPAEVLRGARRAMAERMAKAHAEVVPATVTDQADVDAWPGGADVTLRLIRAVAAGCSASPALNAWFEPETMSRRVHERIDLGIAVDLDDDGLFVPVLRDVGRRDAVDLKRGLERLKADVRQRTIPLGELRGQTITLSNFGTVGGQHAELVVVPPQVGILGVGRMTRQVVAAGGDPAVHRVLPLSLTFDHRAVTGAEAARFLRAVVEELERATPSPAARRAGP